MTDLNREVQAVGAANPLLEAVDIRVEFRAGKRALVAVAGVDLAVGDAESVAIIGESGSGKTTLAMSMMRVHALSRGRVMFDGRDITNLSFRQLNPIRAKMQMVFQNPYSSLDPRMSVARLIAEPLYAQHYGSRAAVADRVEELLDAVALPQSSTTRLPSQFSGGQRQRIAIARALATSPRLLIADEPMSALDVSVQSQIGRLMQSLQERLGIAYLLIAHDLTLVYHLADRVYVMYLGRVVESGSSTEVVYRPLHPYTAALLSATPSPTGRRREKRIVLRGEPPSPFDVPIGCPFHPRCPIARKPCATETPPLAPTGNGRSVACFYPGELPGISPMSLQKVDVRVQPPGNRIRELPT